MSLLLRSLRLVSPGQVHAPLAVSLPFTSTFRQRSSAVIKVVLRKNIADFGKKGDVLSVKRGTARLQLIPNGLAYYGTDFNIKKYARIGLEIPPETMSILKQYRKFIGTISTAKFNFQRFLQPGEAAKVVETGFTIEREVKEPNRQRKEKKKVKKVVSDDPLCDSITPNVLASYLKEKFQVVIPEDSFILENPITTFGEYTIPVTLNHILITGVEEKYLDPDLLARQDFQITVTLRAGAIHKPTKKTQDAETPAEEAGEAPETPAAAAAPAKPETPKGKAAKEEPKAEKKPEKAEKADGSPKPKAEKSAKPAKETKK